ncbi:4'-phosphopantetheinyl transferase superfamily protein [Pseudozobellia sp. WGM2]|uniref:4'-phosphopantetheinyl transferase family protein n=1 Tax=Pseudozobellia sp. WGM2 TaxID=2787625 RepID=UPI001ADEFCD2|nr:4'-phosphopantetheinyl transferase superfamily protein [Pseudozobellia sp. WGM2]
MTKIFYTYISEENHNQLLNNFLPCFSKELQRDILKYRKWQDVQLSLLGKLLLQLGLKRIHVSFRLENLIYNSYGKPFLNNGSIQFNISHSAEIVACVLVDSCEVGIDIEKVTEIDISDFKSQMLLSEWERIMNSSNRKVAFFEYWTQKEAVIKANGMGLAIPIKSFEVVEGKSYCNGIDFSLREVLLDENYKCYLAFNNGNYCTNIQSFKINFSSFLEKAL